MTLTKFATLGTHVQR